MTVYKIGLQTQSITGSHTGAFFEAANAVRLLLVHLCEICCQVSHVLNDLFEVLRFRDNLQGLPSIEPFLKDINTTRRDYRSTF